MEFEELKKKSKAAKTETQIEQKVGAKDIGKEITSGNAENNDKKKGNVNENQKKKRKKQKKQNDNEDVPEKMKKIESETGIDTKGKEEKDLEETASKEIT